MAVTPDTIVAESTPRGAGAVSVVRLSGPEALGILQRLAEDVDRSPEPRKATLARLRDPDSRRALDQALVTYFPGPGSFTGEDVVEISGHGGWLAPALVVEACLGLGARRAEAGEFTRRAYLNGKLDLVQAEAILDLVEGRSRALHGAALGQLDRGLSQRIGALREGLLRLEAFLVHHIDFPEEDEAPVPVAEIGREAEALAGRMEELLATAPEGELLREGALTVLAGRPNSGKSSLFNALVGEERAIVTEVPGTTRDALEAVVSVGGFPFRLVDTAGLRETEEVVERMGIEVARRYVDRADVILLCLPAGEEWGAAESAFLDQAPPCPVILVRTMVDREEGVAGPTGEDGQGLEATLRLSAWRGDGLDELGETLPKLVYRGLVELGGTAPVLTRERQSRGVRRALEEVRAFREAVVAEGIPPEAASAHLKEAESALEEVVGAVSTEDILDRVFREFCIGK